MMKQQSIDEEKKSLIYEKYFTSSTSHNDKNGNGLVSWEHYKKQYYAVENRIKKELDRFNKILHEMSRHSLSFDLEAPSDNNRETNILAFESAQKEYNLVSQNLRSLLDELGEHLSAGNFDQNEGKDAFVKQNMIQRFKEIYTEHKKEYQRLMQSMDYNIKKYELLKESLKFGPSGSSNKMPSSSSEVNQRTNMLIKEKTSLGHSLHVADEIINQAKAVTSSFVAQKMKLTSISGKLTHLKENLLPGVNKLIKDIQNAKHKRLLVYLGVIFCLMFLMILHYRHR